MIEGVIATQEGETTTINGFTGTNLECEGCGAKTEELFETDDSVMLCKECFDSCLEEGE